jgi:hypothetical protein
LGTLKFSLDVAQHGAAIGQKPSGRARCGFLWD